MSDATAFLEEADFEKHPAFFTKETEIGAVLTGEIVEPPRVVETEDLNGQGKTPKLVIAVRHTDGEVYSLWVKQGALATAIVKAAKDATGNREVREGGKLSVKFTGVGTPSKPGYNPPKQWAAKYEAPTSSGVDPADIFGDD